MNYLFFIILLVIISIGYFIVWSVETIKFNELIKTNGVYRIVQIICFSFLLNLVVLLLLYAHKLEKQAKGNCPELEKIENVYKIK